MHVHVASQLILDEGADGGHQQHAGLLARVADHRASRFHLRLAIKHGLQRRGAQTGLLGGTQHQALGGAELSERVAVSVGISGVNGIDPVTDRHTIVGSLTHQVKGHLDLLDLALFVVKSSHFCLSS